MSPKTNEIPLFQEPLPDIVVNGHPNFIPYALLALKNAWRDSFNIDVRTFTHSTMADIGPAAREFEANLAKVPVNAALPKINVTLIWKNCKCDRSFFQIIDCLCSIIRDLQASTQK